MLTIKNPVKVFFFFLLLLATVVTGCTPQGPRALLKGKRSLERGDYARAVEQLSLATSILRTNADAWNSLGLAYHHSGDVSNAVVSYRRAITLDPNLGAARYNLGCLWLEQGRAEQARDELMAFTMNRGNTAEGWLKLGMAQARSRDARDVASAESSFQKALSMDPRNPEAWNELGVFHLQRNRPQNAAQAFTEALKHQTNYAPAVLNLAVVSHHYLNDRASAARRYREYLALQPRPPDANAVGAVLRELEQPARSPVAHQATASAPANHTPPAPPPPPAPAPAPGASPAVTATSPVAPARPVDGARVQSARPAPAPALTNVEVARVAPEPTIRPAQDVPATSVRPAETQVSASATNPGISPPSSRDVARPGEPERRTALQRMNPLNIFRRDSEPEPLPPVAPSEADRARASGAASGGSPVAFARYTYRSPAAPKPGNESGADRAFAQGAQAHRAQRLPEAVVAYRQAVEQNPAHFDAHYNLGLASVAMGNLQQALAAYETALAIRPQSLDARYNFALVLRQARYPVDAAAELQRILEQFPRDARTHAALGNLYAYDLRQTERAREHYMKALESDPRNPQADRIRYWLAENPR